MQHSMENDLGIQLIIVFWSSLILLIVLGFVVYGIKSYLKARAVRKRAERLKKFKVIDGGKRFWNR